jgi:hypothetical protein
MTMALDNWDEVDRLGAELGETLATFSTDFAHLFKRIVAAASLLALGAGLLILGLVLVALGWGGLSHHLLVFGLFPLAASFGMLGRALSARGLRVEAHAGGLLEVRPGRVTALRWQDVNRVTRVAGLKSSHLSLNSPAQLELVGRDGRRLIFHEGLAGLEELTGLAQERTLAWMLPIAVEAYESGAQIGFGALSISQQGLRNSERLLPWELIEDVQLSSSHLVVTGTPTRESSWRIPLAQVPNAHVLMALVERAGKKR